MYNNIKKKSFEKIDNMSSISWILILPIFPKFMKKYLALFWLLASLSLFNFWWTTNAAYDLQIDENNNEVYLLSGETQITLDNVNDYLTWLDADLNLGLINTWAELPVPKTTVWEVVLVSSISSGLS